MAAWVALALALAPTASEPAVTITLSPRPAAAGGATVATVDVTLRFEGIEIERGEPMLRLPLVASNVDTVATVISALEASDGQGAITLSARNVDLPLAAARDAESGGPSREWLSDRAVRGPITVRYTVPANATLPPRGPAPPFSFSNDGAGVSGAGHVFLLMPPGNARYRTTVDWDLSALGKGAQGVSSYGVGRVVAPEPLGSGELRMAYYMAGRLGLWPNPAPSRGFFSAWQGEPPFDAAPLMEWTGTLYGHYAKLFGQKEPPPYGVFLRYNPINAGGGVGLYHSFVTTFGRKGGNGSDPEETRLTLAHEMFHTFQPFISTPAGLESSWFGEGLATFYQRRLPLRFGMLSPDAFLKDLNFHAGRYYTSAMATAPNSEVPRRFWGDTRIRTLPYDRGMLYFATVDHAVRTKSDGRRSLDDLMLAMLEKQKGGAKTSNADWEELLRAELGDEAVTAFRAFLDGARPLPPSDAFGPCFRRTTRPLRQYELGFDTAVLAEPTRVVRGLVAGSAAAQAGLRDGDRIVDPVPQDGIQGNQTEFIELKIRRDGKIFPIRYLPRGETVQAYQWERVSGVPDASCAL